MKNHEEWNLTMLCDFYELTMANGYFCKGYQNRITYFDVFFRKVPDGGGFAIATGLEQIVSYMDTLSTLDTDHVEPMSHIFPLKNVLRTDEVLPSSHREELLAGAPDGDAETFRVPKAVE